VVIDLHLLLELVANVEHLNIIKSIIKRLKIRKEEREKQKQKQDIKIPTF
jgi:hypothetical protein